jgi:hypothetical protein
MDETLRDDIPQVSEEENQILTAPFSEEKIKMAIFGMEHNKAPGPDGFSTKFYQFFWEIVKSDLMSLFHEFHAGRLPIHNLNFGYSLYYQRLLMRSGYSNIGQFAF